MPGLILVSPPTAQLLSVSDAKAQARIDTAVEDHLVADYIAAATDLLETHTWRQYLTATWELSLEGFPAGEIPLPKPPLQSVISVKYSAADGNEQTLVEGVDYRVSTRNTPGKLTPVPGRGWPAAQSGNPEAVVIQFVAGFGAEPSCVPALALQAIRLAVAEWYERRESGNWVVFNQAFARLCGSLRFRDRRLARFMEDGDV